MAMNTLMGDGNRRDEHTTSSKASGRRPPALKISKESRSIIRKPGFPPPRIIHTYSPTIIKTEPHNFMTLVQKLTGSAYTSSISMYENASRAFPSEIMTACPPPQLASESSSSSTSGSCESGSYSSSEGANQDWHSLRGYMPAHESIPEGSAVKAMGALLSPFTSQVLAALPSPASMASMNDLPLLSPSALYTTRDQGGFPKSQQFREPLFSPIISQSPANWSRFSAAFPSPGSTIAFNDMAFMLDSQ